jgi:hypothetical protein
MLLGGLAFVLAVAIVLQLLPYPLKTVVRRDLPLEEFFPRGVAGWSSEDRPLGETESVRGAVKKLLNYDDAFFRVYRKDGREFAVYVAYWLPGKMPAREIAYHVPDKCWVTAGWARTAANYKYNCPLPDQNLAPAQYREFKYDERHQYVIYWHIFDGRPIAYNPNGPPSDFSKLTDLVNLGLRQKGEQYFIRISSATPFQELGTEEAFQQIMELVAVLGPGLKTEVEHLDG